MFVPRGLLAPLHPDGGAQHWFWFSLHRRPARPQAVAQRGRPAPHGRAVLRTATSSARVRGAAATRASASWSCGAAARWHGFTLEDSPLDVVGWDGTVYPWAFPILAFQPRVGSVHLPPTWHGTFAARGALICSFVPRPRRLPPRSDPVPVPAQLDALRRDHLLLRRQLHVAQGRRPGQHLAPPDGRAARPAPRRLREARSARRAPTSSR